MEWVPQEMGGHQEGIRLSEATASMQLIQCASEPLRNLLLKADPNIQSKPIDKVKSIMRQFAVISVAIGVRRTEPMAEALITGTVDSGAMSNLWGPKNFTDTGFSRSDLVHVNMDTRAAKKNPFNIQGVD